MKKLFLLCMALCLLFLGCEKEGVYNPSKKIKRISYQENNGPKYPDSEWSWEKNLLKKIQYFNGFTYSYDARYSYEKNQLVKVEESNGWFWKVSYNSNLYDKVEYFDTKGTIQITVKFTYDKTKVSRMDITFYDYDDIYKNFTSLQGGFMSNLLSKELIQSFERIVLKSKNKAAIPTTYKVTYTYNKDNIKEQVMEYNESDEDSSFSYKSTVKYEKYDNKLNPMYRFYQMGEGIGFVSPKNNPLEVIVETYFNYVYFGEVETDFERYTISCDYSYDGQFPTEAVETQRNSEGNILRLTTFIDYQ